VTASASAPWVPAPAAVGDSQYCARSGPRSRSVTGIATPARPGSPTRCAQRRSCAVPDTRADCPFRSTRQRTGLAKGLVCILRTSCNREFGRPRPRPGPRRRRRHRAAGPAPRTTSPARGLTGPSEMPVTSVIDAIPCGGPAARAIRIRNVGSCMACVVMPVLSTGNRLMVSRQISN